MIFGTVFASSFFQTGICRRHLGLNNNKNRPFYEALKVHVFIRWVVLLCTPFICKFYF
mgnify:CR=1 FL=1